MLTPDTTAVVQLDYKDNEREARVTLRFPFSTPVDMLFAAASVIASAIAPISNAVLFRISVRYGLADLSAPAAALDSDAHRYVALFYRNGNEDTTIWIPSPDLGYFETAGAYAGVRVDYSRAEVKALVDALTVALQQTTDRMGQLRLLQFSAGGLAL